MENAINSERLFQPSNSELGPRTQSVKSTHNKMQTGFITYGNSSNLFLQTTA